MATSNAQQQPSDESRKAIFKGNGLPLGNSLQDQINAVEATEVIFPDVEANQPNSIICGKIDNTIAGVTTDVLQGSHADTRYNADPLLTSDEDTITVHNEDAAITGDDAELVIENFMKNHGRSYDPTIKISAATCDPPSANPGSNEDGSGNCLGAMTRGSSGTMRNVLTISLNDISTHNYGSSIGIFGYAPCDCYVPINLPLLSLVGKLGKASGVWKWFTNGDTFQALLRYTGVWGRYLAKARNAIESGLGQVMRAAKALYDTAIANYLKWVSAHLGYLKKLTKAKKDLSYINKKIAQLTAEIDSLISAISKADQDLITLGDQQDALVTQASIASHMFGTLPDGHPDIPYWIGQMAKTAQDLTNVRKQIVNVTQRRAIDIATKNAKEAKKAVGVVKQNSAIKQRDHWQQMTDIAQAEVDKYNTEATGHYADFLAAEKDYNDAIRDMKKSDTQNVLPDDDVLGLTFGALAALDPSRPKACFGRGTTLCKDTCACVCQDTTDTDCGNNPDEPRWSIVDIISPIQTDEAKICKAACGCHLQVSQLSCLCNSCEPGYTWKDGNRCTCYKEAVNPLYSPNPVTGEWPSDQEPVIQIPGTCIEDDVIAEEEGLGKIWGGDSAYSSACAYLCPGTSDVGLGRSCGLYARLNDNLGAGAPTKEHYLYRTGCNCVCDGRDQLASGGLNQFPPVCPPGYIFDSDPHVCRCKDICSTGVCKWVVECYGCGNMDDCTDEQGNSVPCQYEETYFTSEEYATEAEAQAFIDANAGGGTCSTRMVLEGTSTASGTIGDCP